MRSLLDRAGELASRRVVRDGAWLALGQLGALVARIVGLRLVTELAPPEVYAEVVLLLGLAAFGTNMFCLPLTSALLRFYPDAAAARRVASLRGLLAGILRGRMLVLGAALATVGGLVTLERGSALGLAGFALVSLLLIVDATRLFESSLLNAARRQGLYAAWTVVNEVGRPALAIAGLLVLGPDAASILLGYVVAVVLTNLVFRRFRVRGDDAPEPGGAWWVETRRSALTFSRPLMPVAAITWVLTFSDRYLLAWLGSVEATGIYAAAYGIASMPFILWGSLLTLTLRPIYFDAVARHDLRRERRVLLLWLAVLVIPMAVGVTAIAVLSGPIAKLLLGEAFWGAAPLMPWIAAAYAVQSTKQLFDEVLQAQHRTRRLIPVQGSAAVTAVAFYLLLIPEYGALGGAIGTLCGMGVSLVIAVGLSGAGLRTPANR